MAILYSLYGLTVVGVSQQYRFVQSDDISLKCCLMEVNSQSLRRYEGDAECYLDRETHKSELNQKTVICQKHTTCDSIEKFVFT